MNEKVKERGNENRRKQLNECKNKQVEGVSGAFTYLVSPRVWFRLICGFSSLASGDPTSYTTDQIIIQGGTDETEEFPATTTTTTTTTT